MTKGITGKDYKGTSPNAQHVIWCLTDLFGPVGHGFGWRVVADGIERFDDTAIHWCRIEFWHTDRANTFEAYGQTKMAYMTRGENSYLKVDEDAPKKSLTDAITKAASQIGIAANIFLGRWDDNKYVANVASDFAKKAAPPKDPDVIRDGMLKVIRSCESADQINAAIGGAKFDAAWQWLAEHHEGHSAEVRRAVDKARANFEAKNADLGGDEIPFQ
jgi:hypothetical protein